MQSVALITLMLVAFASAAPQPEQGSNSNSVSVSSQPQSGSPVVSNSPVVPASVNSVNVVEGSQSVSNVEQQQPSHHPPSVASYYAPAGLITVMGEQGNKPVPVGAPVRNFEQYGQPESAALPANYKPFGSWGLYIGGNPADGYYTNYYKALGSSVAGDKPQVGAEQAKPSAVVGQTSAFSPILRQAGSSPYVGGDYYPFAYAPSELNSAVPVPQQQQQQQQQYSQSALSPVQAGAQIYGSPAVFESNYGVSPYADAYATKKVGAAYAQKELPKEAQITQSAQSSKGYQSRVYVYPSVGSPSVGQLAAPVVSSIGSNQGHQHHNHQQHHHHQQAQVVAYPVPVGSQIVGSQSGVDGAFNPYGVHAFTRYAVKPTVVGQEVPSYYYSVHSPSGVPAYKQQQVYSSQPAVGQSSYYPFSFYGYPMNQLHYSQASVVPAGHSLEPHHSPAQGPQVELAAEKSESEAEKYRQQKRA